MKKAEDRSAEQETAVVSLSHRSSLNEVIPFLERPLRTLQDIIDRINCVFFELTPRHELKASICEYMTVCANFLLLHQLSASHKKAPILVQHHCLKQQVLTQ